MNHTNIANSHKSIWRRSYDGSNISLNDIISIIKQKIDYTVHVGTDSHNSRSVRDRYVFSSTICLYLEGKGGFYFFCRDVPDIKYSSLSGRLTEEVNRSLAVSNSIRKVLANRKIAVHVDVNKDTKFKSGKFSSIFKSWVMSSGYSYVQKPDSWASCCVADRHAK